ncbi:MAG TPA: YggT family protein [Actinomycetota bacterium]|nr:YggT family protein [Actinomycetota bacterium]
MRRIFCDLLALYWLILFIRILLSWFPPPGSGPLRTGYNLIYDLTEPVLRPVRGLLPPIRAGSMGLDLSPILVFIVIFVLQAAVCR